MYTTQQWAYMYRVQTYVQRGRADLQKFSPKQTTNQGLQSSWNRYTEILLEFAEGAGSLDQPELLIPLLPSSLDPRSCFVPTRFSTVSTSPAIIFGLDKYLCTSFSSPSQSRFVEAFPSPPTPRASSQGTPRQNVREQRKPSLSPSF